MEKNNTLHNTNNKKSCDTHEINMFNGKDNSSTTAINVDSNPLVTSMFKEFNVVVIRQKYSKKYRKQYESNNKEKLALMSKDYYERNKDKIRKKQQVWYECNKDKIREKHRVYYAENKEAFRKNYQLKNK